MTCRITFLGIAFGLSLLQSVFSEDPVLHSYDELWSDTPGILEGIPKNTIIYRVRVLSPYERSRGALITVKIGVDPKKEDPSFLDFKSAEIELRYYDLKKGLSDGDKIERIVKRKKLTKKDAMGFLKAIDHCMVFQLHDDPPRFENRIVRENIPRDAASVIFERAASVSPDYRKVWGHLDGTEKPVQMAFDAFTKLVKDLKPK